MAREVKRKGSPRNKEEEGGGGGGGERRYAWMTLSRSRPPHEWTSRHWNALCGDEDEWA